MGDDVTTIHFGFDESNHCPSNQKNCEIIVATASVYGKDGKKKAPRKKRSAQFRDAWLRNDTKPWAFTLLTFDQFIKTQYNLVLVAPELIDNLFFYIRSIVPDNGEVKAVIHMDGKVRKPWRKLLKRELLGYFDDVRVRQYIKGDKNRKMQTYPNVVRAADNIANYLFRGNLENVNNNPRYVSIPLEELITRQKRLESSQ